MLAVLAPLPLYVSGTSPLTRFAKSAIRALQVAVGAADPGRGRWVLNDMTHRRIRWPRQSARAARDAEFVARVLLAEQVDRLEDLAALPLRVIIQTKEDMAESNPGIRLIGFSLY